MLVCAGQYVPVKVEHPTAPAPATELRQQVRAVLARCSMLDPCCRLVSRLETQSAHCGRVQCELAGFCCFA